jgi:hypothetical protein
MMPSELWPSCSETTFTGTPACRAPLAAVRRRSWRRIGGSPGFATLGLGFADFGLPADLHDLLGDAEVPGVQVDVTPLDADRLASAKDVASAGGGIGHTTPSCIYQGR